MGCTGSSTETSAEEKEAHRAIEQGLRQDRQKQQKEVKILLLGAGEAGKSTFVFFLFVCFSYVLSFSDGFFV